MRICIYGAGAIGGHLGAKLASAREATGAEVSLVARGAHLDAIRRGGLTLVEGGARTTVAVAASDDPAALGVQDYVVVALKAHQVPGVVATMQPLLGPDTCVVTAVNGVPWWYFYRLEGRYENRRVEAVDPGGVQWDVIGPERALGCVVYPAAAVTEPGVVTHLDGERYALGEPSGERSARAQRLAKALQAAGLKAPVRAKIRDELWVKLWGNLAFNPISALTGATLDVVATDAGTRAVARAMMLEARTVAETLGVRFAIDVEARIDGAASVGAHKTSMLQDLERGRPLELDALVTAVQELGRITETPTPTLDTVLALIRLRAATARG